MSEKASYDGESWKLRNQTRSSLAKIYNMNYYTFLKCIAAIEHKFRFKEEGRRVLTTREIGYIVDHMGEPEIIVNSKQHGLN